MAFFSPQCYAEANMKKTRYASDVLRKYFKYMRIKEDLIKDFNAVHTQPTQYRQLEREQQDAFRHSIECRSVLVLAAITDQPIITVVM